MSTVVVTLPSGDESTFEGSVAARPDDTLDPGQGPLYVRDENTNAEVVTFNQGTWSSFTEDSGDGQG